MADVIANMSVADVITTGADVIASHVYLFCYWLMLLPMCGRWYSHFRAMWWLMLLPSGRCYCQGSLLFYFKFWDVKQNLIPYVWQMVFAYISIQGWIV